MPSTTEIETLVIETIQQLSEDFEIEQLKEPSMDTALYTEGGTLDSMALVNLISDLEDAVAERFKINISLADEKAMSARKSPYRNASSLSAAIIERLPQ